MHTEGEGKRRGEQSPHATRSRAVGLAIWHSTLTQTHFAIAKKGGRRAKGRAYRIENHLSVRVQIEFAMRIKFLSNPKK